MKTAISVPDAIFAQAEQVAERGGLSRSELYTRALARYLEENRYAGVRERLNALYAADPEQSTLDPVLAQLQSASMCRDD